MSRPRRSISESMPVLTRKDSSSETRISTEPDAVSMLHPETARELEEFLYERGIPYKRRKRGGKVYVSVPAEHREDVQDFFRGQV